MSNSIYQSWEKKTQRWKFNLRKFWKNILYTSWMAESVERWTISIMSLLPSKVQSVRIQ